MPYKVQDYCWMGISDTREEGDWIYVSGARKNRMIWSSARKGKPKCNYYTNWMSGQPNNTNNNEHHGVICHDAFWYDTKSGYTFMRCVICETPRNDIQTRFKDCTATATKSTTPTDSLSYSLTMSPTVSKTLSRSGSSSLSQVPTESHTISQSLTASPTSSPTGSLTPNITTSDSVTPTYPSISECSEVTNASQPLFVTVADLFPNGVMFEFTVSRPLVSDDGVVEALLWGVENSTASLVAKCHTTTLSRHTCKFPPPPASLPSENVSGIYIRYIPSPSTSCPLGFAMWCAPR